MIKVSEKVTGNGEKFIVKIEKLRKDNGNYKTLSFTIYLNGKVVYNKSDLINIYDNER